MAYFRRYKDKWRAEVQKHGTRITKVLDTKEEAVAWAESHEKTLDKAASMRMLSQKFIHDLDRPLLMSAVPGRVLRAMDKIPYCYGEVCASSYLFGTGVGIYFLLLRGEIVYVGQTKDFLARIYRHKRERKEFDGFAFMQCGADQLDELEADYIDAFLPPYNRSTGRPIKKVHLE